MRKRPSPPCDNEPPLKRTLRDWPRFHAERNPASKRLRAGGNDLTVAKRRRVCRPTQKPQAGCAGALGAQFDRPPPDSDRRPPVTNASLPSRADCSSVCIADARNVLSKSMQADCHRAMSWQRFHESRTVWWTIGGLKTIIACKTYRRARQCRGVSVAPVHGSFVHCISRVTALVSCRNFVLQYIKPLNQ